MTTEAETFLIQYAKGKTIEIMISDGGGNLPNNTKMIAAAMEAYRQSKLPLDRSEFNHTLCNFLEVGADGLGRRIRYIKEENIPRLLDKLTDIKET
jgi:hypothetical protein